MPRAEAMRIGGDGFEPAVLLGSSAAARRLAESIRAAAGAPYALVHGERGMDLAHVACAVHRRSGRTGSCVLLEEQAAVDADAIDGALARACGGTLVVGDLADLPDTVQRRLTRSSGGAAPTSNDSAPRSSGASVIAALSVAEADLAESGVRRDLYRRLARARIHVSPLRDRAEDIPVIAEAVLRAACADAGIARRALSAAALTLISAMPWRGNLSQLREVLQRSACGAAGDAIELADVLAHVQIDMLAAPNPPAKTLRAARRQFEREYIQQMLQHHGGRVGDAARMLGIQRTNLYRKARQLGISVSRPEHA